MINVSGAESTSLNNPEELDKLIRKIKISYRYLTGGENGIEDCVQEVLLMWLQKKRLHTAIRFCVMDYLRARDGRKDLKSTKTKKEIEKHPKQLYEDNGFNHPQTFMDESNLTFDICKYIANEIDRACFLLYYKWEFNLREIAELFDIDIKTVRLKLIELESFLKKVTKN